MTKYPFDLQTHSFFSDGDYMPEEVMKRAKRSGLLGVVLTDHNTINGTNRAIQEANRLGLLTLEGIEITATFNKVDIHILGYARKFKRAVIQEGLRNVIVGSNERVRLMTQKVNSLNIRPPVDFKKLLRSKGKGGMVVKYDIMRELRKNLKDSKQIGFIPLFSRGGAAYVPYGKWALTPEAAVSLIQQAGGLAFMAHPGAVERSSHSASVTKRLINELIYRLTKCGLAGIEVHYSKHTQRQELEFLTLAQKLRLLVGGGSDWHGELHHPEIELGSGGVTNAEFNRILTAIKKLG
ncbi:MAG: PHP domain-containing protein [Candidatus Kerfeldbacteria bacterium]|nr:PHP domain-containing protein [Candidatus Kerfeldbacteria bacterium]